jgi:hypothetical protein
MWKHLLTADLDASCVKFWRQYDIVHVYSFGSPCNMILDGHIPGKEGGGVQPWRDPRDDQGERTMFGEWMFPARMYGRCERFWPVTQERQINGCYIVMNRTLVKYTVKIQKAWRAYHQTKVSAARIIQRQFHQSMTNPAYMLCRLRLMREFIKP